MSDAEAYVGIGSNIDPERHIGRALAALARDFGPTAVSPFYRSAPVGFEGPDFVNGVVRISPSGDDIDALAVALKRLEREAGRREFPRTASRELDLDLLLWGTRVLRRGKLVLPRPDVLEYAFVLRPLAELAPAAVHPVTGRTYAWHWDHFEGEPLALHAVEPPVTGARQA